MLTQKIGLLMVLKVLTLWRINWSVLFFCIQVKYRLKPHQQGTGTEAPASFSNFNIAN